MLTKHSQLFKSLIHFYKNNGYVICNVESLQITNEPEKDVNIMAYKWASDLANACEANSITYTLNNNTVTSIYITNLVCEKCGSVSDCTTTIIAKNKDLQKTILCPTCLKGYVK